MQSLMQGPLFLFYVEYWSTVHSVTRLVCFWPRPCRWNYPFQRRGEMAPGY
ncbi:hypothetical protein CGRA01v4_12254 [Colletotrichum graminicola]|nr:hypothetical protein CGRA01v4_12254 [Colletotrichum graminicola]